MATRLVNYRLPEELVARVAAQAERSGLTRTEIVRDALEARLRRVAPIRGLAEPHPPDTEPVR